MKFKRADYVIVTSSPKKCTINNTPETATLIANRSKIPFGQLFS